MSKGLNLYWRYLTCKPRLLFRRHILLRLKSRLEFQAGPAMKGGYTFPDCYVMEQRDMHDDFYLLMYDALFRRWIRTRVNAGVYVYGVDESHP